MKVLYLQKKKNLFRVNLQMQKYIRECTSGLKKNTFIVNAKVFFYFFYYGQHKYI